MEQAAAAFPQQTIKISSKRQITIPAKWYREKQFTQYALAELTDEGILIKPIEVDREDVTLSILRRLAAEGYKGDDLVDKYEELRAKIIPIEKPTSGELAQLEAAGETPKGRPAGRFMREILEDYGDVLAEEAGVIDHSDEETRDLDRSILEGLVDYIEGNTVDFDEMIAEGRRRLEGYRKEHPEYE